MGAYDEPAGAAMPTTAAGPPMATSMPYPTPTHAAAIPTAEPVPMQQMPMMVQLSLPPQQSCA
eukprot:482101-Rhodomonas_salina.4